MRWSCPAYPSARTQWAPLARPFQRAPSLVPVKSGVAYPLAYCGRQPLGRDQPRVIISLRCRIFRKVVARYRTRLFMGTQQNLSAPTLIAHPCFPTQNATSELLGLIIGLQAKNSRGLGRGFECGIKLISLSNLSRQC